MNRPYYYKYGVVPQGFNAEERFFNLCNKNNIPIQHTSLKENKKHKDFIIFDNLSIDIKSMKKISRQDEYVQDKLIWIELENFGRKGWLFGNQNLLGFEYSDGFLLVWRDKLETFVMNKLINEFVKKPQDALYKKYFRYGNIATSVLTLIKMDDIPSEIVYMKMSFSKSSQNLEGVETGFHEEVVEKKKSR